MTKYYAKEPHNIKIKAEEKQSQLLIIVRCQNGKHLIKLILKKEQTRAPSVIVMGEAILFQIAR